MLNANGEIIIYQTDDGLTKIDVKIQNETAQYYSIQSVGEAEEYLENEYLHNNLIEICNELLKLKQIIQLKLWDSQII